MLEPFVEIELSFGDAQVSIQSIHPDVWFE